MPEPATKVGWTRVAFGDVVERVTESAMPTAEDSRTYIGLEHLDSDSFKIHKWGSDVNIKVTKTRVREGDVLFARRNTHLRRCAIAPFDAYFSPDGYAFRSKSSQLLHDMLLYVVSSDGFMDFAVEHSAGTHSKRVKWSDLEKYEFALPPLDEQRRMVRALSAADELAECYGKALAASNRLHKSAAIDLFDRMKRQWPVQEIGDVLEVSTGGTPSRGTPSFWRGDIPWVKTAEVNFQVIKETEERITREGLRDSAAKLCPAGSILIALYGQGPTRGRVAMLGIEAATNQACAVILPSIEIDPWFVYFYLEGQYEALRALAHGAAQPNLNLAMIKRVPIPVPAQESQTELVAVMHTLTESRRVLSSRIVDLRRIGKRLVEGAFV